MKKEINGKRNQFKNPHFGSSGGAVLFALEQLAIGHRHIAPSNAQSCQYLRGDSFCLDFSTTQ